MFFLLILLDKKKNKITIRRHGIMVALVNVMFWFGENVSYNRPEILNYRIG